MTSTTQKTEWWPLVFIPYFYIFSIMSNSGKSKQVSLTSFYCIIPLKSFDLTFSCTPAFNASFGISSALSCKQNFFLLTSSILFVVISCFTSFALDFFYAAFFKRDSSYCLHRYICGWTQNSFELWMASKFYQCLSHLQLKCFGCYCSPFFHKTAEWCLKNRELPASTPRTSEQACYTIFNSHKFGTLSYRGFGNLQDKLTSGKNGKIQWNIHF